MRNTVLRTDIALAVVAAILILVLSPGLAIAGLIALTVLLAFVVTAVRSTRRRGRDAVRVRTRRAERSSVRTRTRSR